MSKALKYFEDLIKGFVSNPEKIIIKETQDDQGTLLKLWVEKKDMGVVIGKKAANFNAIKLIMKLVGFKLNTRIAIQIGEPEK